MVFMCRLLFTVVLLLIPLSSYAILEMELTRGSAGSIPIAVIPFTVTGQFKPTQDISNIITNDLQNSGRFKVFGRKQLTQLPTSADDASTAYFKSLAINNVVIGKVTSDSPNVYKVHFELLDTLGGGEHPQSVISKEYQIGGESLRAIAHHISDLIYQHITGIKGIFSTKLVYVVVQRSENGRSQYVLEIADQDGYNPRPLLSSAEPIMSPSWSPNGKQIAYVSFEKRRAGIYIQEVATGTRRLLTEFPGINGAPAFSPDGSKIALVLSKSGSPNIYIMDLASRQLKSVTHDFYINTEPAWAADGKSLLYTSNKAGGPQIYRVDLSSGNTSRLTFSGDYNARPSITRDNRSVVMIHRVSGVYNIAILDLTSGNTRVLTTAANGDSASPSMAPNGTMILYDTVFGGRNVLGMVSADGRVQLVLPARNGEAQSPAWSPFIS